MASARKLGKFFFIRSKETGDVLEAQSKKSGSSVITSVSRDEDHGNSKQLWYMDERTQTIRNKWSEFCLDHNPSDDRAVIRPFSPSRKQQRWVIIDGLIQTQEDFELVLGAPVECGAPAVVIANDGSDSVMWDVDYRPAQFFLLRSRKLKDKVLDVEKAKEEKGTKVIVWSDKDTTADNQLWYEDRQGIIRSKLTDFVIDASGKEVVMKPYKHTKKMQQWFYTDGKIQNWSDPSKVIALQPGRIPLVFYDTVSVQTFSSSPHQYWDQKFIKHSPAMYNHGGFGKYFLIKCSWDNVVLSLQNDNKHPGVAVVTDYKKSLKKSGNTQLFYMDDVTGTIRDRENDFCLELSDGILTSNIYNPGADDQQWKFYGRKIQNRMAPTMVLTVQTEDVSEELEDQSECEINCHVTSAAFHNLLTQQFEREHILAECFLIRNVNSGRVIDVYKGDRSVGTKVIQWEQKPTVCENQLWYEDETGIIRSKLTGYVIQADDSGSKMVPYDVSKKSQHWIRVGDRIQNKHDSGQVLDVRFQSKWNWMAIVSAGFDGGDSQKWTFSPV